MQQIWEIYICYMPDTLLKEKGSKVKGKESKSLPFLKAMPTEFGSKVHEQEVAKQQSKCCHRSTHPIQGHERAELTASWEW